MPTKHVKKTLLTKSFNQNNHPPQKPPPKQLKNQKNTPAPLFPLKIENIFLTLLTADACRQRVCVKSSPTATPLSTGAVAKRRISR